jgi:DHA2 family multidrug resistance protein
VGGSVGISLVNTIVARHEQVHRAYLTPNIHPGNTLLQNQLQGLESYLDKSASAAGAALADPAQQAYGLLNQLVSQQAALLSYVDDFRYVAFLCFLCVPLVFLLKRTVGKRGAVHAAH